MRASAEFSDTVAHGAHAAAGPVVVHLWLPAPSQLPQPASHVGLVVSRAVGNAVVRHRVSRRLRALLASRIGILPDGSRVVVRARPAAALADSATLAAALDQALARATNRTTARVETAASATGVRR
jgi:ribonuclease P protein component